MNIMRSQVSMTWIKMLHHHTTLFKDHVYFFMTCREKFYLFFGVLLAKSFATIHHM